MSLLDLDSKKHISPTFADLRIKHAVLQAVGEVGYVSPSSIQVGIIPVMLAGSDVVGLAQTGTGKTAAFAIPILSKIDTYSCSTQALILVPTRELALQVSEAFSRYSVHLPTINVLPIYGGTSYSTQLSGLRRGAQVIVGTPGRIIDHITRKTLDLTRLNFLVLDEADEMLTMGFAEEVERVIIKTPQYKQVALFSATMPSAIQKITNKYLQDPVEVIVKSKTATAENISQKFVQVNTQRKLDALTRILEVEQNYAMIVFVRTKQATEEVAEKLKIRGFAVAALNGDINQIQRERTITLLKEGTIDILIATDVAARGLDVERLSHVINYDIPYDIESYVHRIGRTGRAGRSGHAILFITPREKHLLKLIEKHTRSKIHETELPSISTVNDQRIAKFRKSITNSLNNPVVELFRPIIEEYKNKYTIPSSDIAAALALQLCNGEEFLMTELSLLNKQKEYSKTTSCERDFKKRNISRKGLATYRISLGKQHKVGPSHIVGAIANEGGLNRKEFGQITIFKDYSLVELPEKLSIKTLKALKNTRISGLMINLTLNKIEYCNQPTTNLNFESKKISTYKTRFKGNSSLESCMYTR